MSDEGLPLLRRAGVLDAAEEPGPELAREGRAGPPILAPVVHRFEPGWRPLRQRHAVVGGHLVRSQRPPLRERPDMDRCASCGARAEARCHGDPDGALGRAASLMPQHRGGG